MVARRVIVYRCDTPLWTAISGWSPVDAIRRYGLQSPGVGFCGFRLGAESSRGRVERHRVDVENFSPKLNMQSYAKSLIFTTPQLKK